MITRKITRIPRAPRISSGIRIEGGGTANQECLADGEIYPNRTMVPLVLQPFVSYSEGTTGRRVENANPELIDGVWYRLDSSNRDLGLCNATKINTSKTGTNANGQTITVFTVISTPGATNYGQLTIRENVPANENITYVFEATLSADGSPIQVYFNTKCTSVAEIPDIEFDNNATGLYDPLHDTQYFTINPSLTIDCPVTWKWKSYHELEGGWVDLGSTLLDWCIDKVGDGIRIDRKRMQDVLILKCTASVTVDGMVFELEKAVTHTRLMPSFEYDVIRVGDMPEDVDAFAPYAEIKSGTEIITSDAELNIEWLNSSEQVVATGINPTISISSLPDGIYQLSVRDRGGYAAIVDDGKLLTDDNKLVLTRSKS